MYSDKRIKEVLEDIYSRFHHREFINPDPLQFLYNYNDLKDREIVGLIASSLALGRVNAINKTVKSILLKLPSPYNDLMAKTEKEISLLFQDFKYRFYKHEDLISLLLAIKKIIEKYGSLNNCFLAGYSKTDDTVLKGLTFFVGELTLENPLKMIAHPEKGSACKRLVFYLRWMVRSDNIDPGGWKGISKDKLIIPLDTHMFKTGKLLKLTERNDAGMKTALEITENLKKYDKNDPVRFDFSLTRPGIHPDLDYSQFDL